MKLWDNKSRSALTYPAGYFIPASPALSVVPLCPESTCVLFELKELIKTGSRGGAEPRQPLQRAILLASETLAVACAGQRDARVPTQCKQHSPLLLLAAWRVLLLEASPYLC